MNVLALAILAFLAALWVFGSILYFVTIWRDIVTDLSTPGRRWWPLLDLFITLAWPLLIIIDAVLSSIYKLRRARIASRH